MSEILPRLERVAGEVAAAQCSQVRRSSFEDLCSRHCALARGAGGMIGRTFPLREVRQKDFGLSVGIVRPLSLQELAGLVADLKAAEEDRCSAANALPCPKAAGRVCQMRDEIDPNRFDVFFAIPFCNPPSCNEACDSLIEWLKTNRGMAENRLFRADKWTCSGDFVCKICKAIQESRVVVADIAGGPPNVFFELGLAAGMGKPTILICDEKAKGGRHQSDRLAREYVPCDGVRRVYAAVAVIVKVVRRNMKKCRQNGGNSNGQK